jgi:hypothetical protein
MYTITEKTRQMLIDTFNENEKNENFYYPNSKTTKELEKDYLAEKLDNLNLELPSKLLFSTMSGIEEQILRCVSDNRPSSDNVGGFLGFYSRVLTPEEKAEREENLKSFLALEEELNAISDHMGKKLKVPTEIVSFSVDKFLIINTETTVPN